MGPQTAKTSRQRQTTFSIDISLNNFSFNWATSQSTHAVFIGEATGIEARLFGHNKLSVRKPQTKYYPEPVLMGVAVWIMQDWRFIYVKKADEQQVIF